MKTASVPSEYVGALLSDERSLTLVRIDPKDPWDAFRRLRRMIRRMPEPPSGLSFYESDTPIENEARVISLDSRRRAG